MKNSTFFCFTYRGNTLYANSVLTNTVKNNEKSDERKVYYLRREISFIVSTFSYTHSRELTYGI